MFSHQRKPGPLSVFSRTRPKLNTSAVSVSNAASPVQTNPWRTPAPRVQSESTSLAYHAKGTISVSM